MAEDDKQLTCLSVNSAYSLMMPCKYPNITDTGKKIISDGSRMNKPTSLTHLVIDIQTSWATTAYNWSSEDQRAVAWKVKKMMRGSKRKDREVKVAMCKA